MNLNCLGKIPIRKIYLSKILRLMKLTILFMSLGMFFVSARTYSQKVSYKGTDVALEDVLKDLGRQSGYYLFYKYNEIKDVKIRVIDIDNIELAKALDKTLEDLPFDFRLKENTIIVNKIMKDKAQKAVVSPGRVQTPITGTVKNSAGRPLHGATVIVKNTRSHTITDEEGAFQFPTVPSGAILVISFVGYDTQEVAVGGREIIPVILAEQEKDLDEVIVIGYGTVAKEDLTGSISQVNVEDLMKAPVASFDQALAGRVAGVQVSSMEDGQPGEGMNIVIRGANSLTQDNSPLYVIDGFAVDGPETAGINPDDIESITVLKDASATAIYGSRAANGVVVIETKKGKIGRPVITVNSSVGPQTTPKKMEMLNAYEFVKYQVERYGNTGLARYTPADLNPSHASYDPGGYTLESYRNIPGVDWQDELFKTGLTQIHNFSIRGGTQETRYSISGSAYDQDAIILNTGYKRYQTRLSLDQTINEKFKVGMNANYSHQKGYGQILGRTSATSSTTISGYLLYSTWGYRPVTGREGDIDYELGDILDDIVDEDVDDEGSDFRINPLVSARETLRERLTNNFTANAYATYDLTKDLELKVTGGLTGVMYRNNAFYNSKTVRGTPLRPNNINGVNGSIRNNNRLDWLNENILTYKKRINRAHRIEAMVGMTHQSRRQTLDGFSAIQVPNEELGLYGLAQGLPLENSIGASESRLQSYFGRFNYNYKSRYLFTVTMRADGSSKFPRHNRWGYFPSGAFAWNMGREGFVKDIAAVSDAKLRISYGVTGNDRVSDFAPLASAEWNDLASYSFDNVRYFGLNMERLSNPNLKWESTAQFDIGYDLSLFKDRINFVFDWYRKTTYDLLLNAQIPYTTGYSTAYKNIGRVRNQGLEFTLNTVNLRSKDFTWESNFNISFNKNKILALNEDQPNMLSTMSSFVTRMAQEPMYIAEVGAPAAMFYGLVWDGVYQYSDFDEISPGVYRLKLNVPDNGDSRTTIQPGDIKYKDLNGDGVVDASDKTVIGSGLPKHIGGFTNNFSYKGFDLNVLFQWSYGNDLLNANRLIFEGNITNVHHFNQYASWADRWTPENPSNTIHRAGGGGPQVISSRVIEDGSYLRLKTVMLAYNIPQSITSGIGIQSLRMSVAAQNLLTWTNYSGMDPEVSVRHTVLTPGFDFSAYPHARTVVFGLRARL
ncbi:TonB-dependent receptor [Sphingobacterium sp. SGG-5]|nr:TonB-dependent receptor [Sphingobacterium sp. SGG-5]